VVGLTDLGHRNWSYDTTCDELSSKHDKELLYDNGLKITVNKTFAVMLTCKRGYLKLNFKLDDENKILKDHVQYLGVVLNGLM